MVDKEDWRLTNQEKYLKGVTLIHTIYKRNSDDRHDHCEFCWEEFENEVSYGYCTINQYHWICDECFRDFKEMFNWKVLDNSIDSEVK